MNRFKNSWGVVLVIGCLLLLFSLLPLGKALYLGEDEGFEVIKGFMCFKGFVLYKDIWNDQPPLLTKLLSGAFSLFGPSILIARIVAAAFGLLLFATFHELVRLRSGPKCALVAIFFLIAAPGVLMMSVSVMLEVPAFATGLLSAWFLFKWDQNRHWAWLVCSGIVMAIALQIKLTAALVVPAICIELARLSYQRKSGSQMRRLMTPALLWAMSMLAVFAFIGITWGKGSLVSSWQSHTSAHIVSGLDREEDHKFDSELLANHIECVCATALAILLALKWKRWGEINFPVVLLLTAAFIHAFHRPWWNYYYLHLAIPLAWLAGWLVSDWLNALLQLYARNRFRLNSRATWKMLGLCGLVGLPLTRSEQRLEGAVKDLRNHPSAEANPIVQKMKAYADRTKWVYSESGIYPFHARLPVIPYLTIIMPKRFWSGQISTQEIIDYCQRWRPEMIVLPKIHSSQWNEFLEQKYSLVAMDKDCDLYLFK